MTSTATDPAPPALAGGPPDQASARPRGHARTVIEPPGIYPSLELRELWTYRNLFFFLVWRDIKVRYAQTVLGAGWAILQPLLTMVVFTVIFGNLARIPSDGVPYPIFSLAALVPWTYFSNALSQSSNSLITNTNLITKIYFPRLVIPWAPVLAGLVDLVIAFGILLLMLAAYGVMPSPSALWAVPLLTVVTALTVAGTGTLLAALNVQFRDVKHVVPFLVQVWMYASPIVYPLSLVPERFRAVYALNPMVGVIEGFRATLLRTGPIDGQAVLVSSVSAVALFAAGSFYFKRAERLFADVA